MSDIELDYDYLTQHALRRVVYDVLSMTAELGATPGDHHFYIEFQTGAPGVTIPPDLHETYPERMTIVLQHQFENLIVNDDSFSVSLWFKGKQSHLSIPFEAVTSFADPSVQFGLRFNDIAVSDEPLAPDAAQANGEDAETDASPDEDKSDAQDGADVVSLDAFRKK